MGKERKKEMIGMRKERGWDEEKEDGKGMREEYSMRYNNIK